MTQAPVLTFKYSKQRDALCPVYKMDRFDVVRKVPHLTDEQLKDVRVEDRALMIDV